MGRYTGPKWKLCRREGMDLFRRGASSAGKDSPLKRRDYPPGVHAQRRSKVSDFGVRLREKQKLKRIYGVRERQFMNLFAKAGRMKGNTGENLLNLMERRLDAVVVTAGFALSIPQARQLVVHGHFRVNGKRVNVPSYSVMPGDIITARDKESSQKMVEQNVELNTGTHIPPWVSVDGKAKTATVVSMPKREDFPYPIVEQLIVECCSK